MCGIWGLLGQAQNVNKLFESFQNIKIRGPDRSEFFQWTEKVDVYLGFHRLTIIDKSVEADQPFVFEDKSRKVIMGCNGEIYNFEELIKEYSLPVKSHSDCEVILYLFMKLGMEQTIKKINGEFAFYLLDYNKEDNKLHFYLGRDQCGIRPLFFGESKNKFAFASEIKGLTVNMGNEGVTQVVDDIKQFPPRTYLEVIVEKNGDNVSFNKTFHEYTTFRNIPITITDREEAMSKIREVFYEAVRCRIRSDRPMGALLSGGLDSSLTASIFARELDKQGRKLHTFSIGMPGATDRKYAEMVAKKIGSIHHHVDLTRDQFINEVEEVVRVTETFDITTIRATVGNYLIGKWISKNTDIKVVLIGDGSDELCSGYMYFFNAPTPLDSHNENIRLVEDIHKYDVLRADRGVADNGLEARVPFLDENFIKLYLSIDPKFKIPSMTSIGVVMEKALLRDSFKDMDLLPKEVLYRRKEAFSDGVSSKDDSWYVILQKWCDKQYSKEDISKSKITYPYLSPISSESLYYRELFTKYYGKGDIQKVVPYYWLPLWSGDVKEPSARILDVYES